MPVSYTHLATLFVVFTCTAAAGVLILCLTRPLANTQVTSSPGDEHNELLRSTEERSDVDVALEDDVLRVTSPKARIVAMLHMFRDRVMLFLLLPFFLTGFELAFWTGEFPPGVLTQDVIGLVLMWSGVGEVIGGLLWGYISDSHWGPAVTFEMCIRDRTMRRQKHKLDGVEA